MKISHKNFFFFLETTKKKKEKLKEETHHSLHFVVVSKTSSGSRRVALREKTGREREREREEERGRDAGGAPLLCAIVVFKIHRDDDEEEEDAGGFERTRKKKSERIRSTRKESKNREDRSWAARTGRRKSHREEQRSRARRRNRRRHGEAKKDTRERTKCPRGTTILRRRLRAHWTHKSNKSADAHIVRSHRTRIKGIERHMQQKPIEHRCFGNLRVRVSRVRRPGRCVGCVERHAKKRIQTAGMRSLCISGNCWTTGKRRRRARKRPRIIRGANEKKGTLPWRIDTVRRVARWQSRFWDVETSWTTGWTAITR